MNSKSVHVFILAYNEEESVQGVVKELRQLKLDLRIHVLDDGSRDATAERAKEAGARVIKHPVNLGGGAALRTVFTVALMDDADFIATLDADGQHDPVDFSRLVEAVEQSDLVIGSRFRNEQRLGMPFYRRLGIRFFSWLITKVGKVNVTDATSCYRIYDSKTIWEILPKLKENQYYALETILRMAKYKARIIEVPIRDIPRMKGKSKKGILSYGYNLLRVIMTFILSIQ